MFYILLFLSLLLQKSLKSGRDCCPYVRTEPFYLSTQIKSSLTPTPFTGDRKHWWWWFAKTLVFNSCEGSHWENPIFIQAWAWRWAAGVQNSNHRYPSSESTALLEASRRSAFWGTDATPRGFCKLLHCSFIMRSDEWYEQDIPKEASSPAHQEASKVRAMPTPQRSTAGMRSSGQCYYFKISLLCVPRIQTHHSGPREAMF